MCRFSDTFFEFFLYTGHTVIIQFHSNLRSREVCCISFLGKNWTSLSFIQLIIHLFCTIIKFCTKKQPKSGAHCYKNEIYFLNIFWMVLGIKKIRTHSNSRGCALLALWKWKKLNLKMCTVKTNLLPNLFPITH